MLNSIGHLLNNLHCADADSADPLQQVDNVFPIVSKFVGIEKLGDRWVFGFLLFVLVDLKSPLPDRSTACQSAYVRDNLHSQS
jgi:hypothetical protein